MTVYAVVVSGEGYTKVSSECYDTYEKAVAFIKTRSEMPLKKGDYMFSAKGITYQIEMLNVR